MNRDKIQALLLEAQDHDLGPVAHSLINDALEELQRLPIEPLLAVSTGHLNTATLEDLQSGRIEWVITYPNEYGAFVLVTDALMESVPEDLRNVMNWAREHGIHWVKLDPDGTVINDLPWREW